jgi:hypothetical protein
VIDSGGFSLALALWICPRRPIRDRIANEKILRGSRSQTGRVRQRVLEVSAGEDQLRALMIRYQGGSLEAFQEIYAQLAAAVLRYLFHLAGGSEIADDLLQETFLQIHR